jgi:hypothetical protein
MAVPLYHIDMTPLTDNPSCDILPMIEIPALDFNISLRFDMARGTPSHSTGNALLLLPSRASLVVVTDETVDFMNGEVCSLNELGVASRTAKFHSPLQLA